METKRDHNMISVDPDKLLGHIRKVGKNEAQVSVELGYSENFFSKVRRNGRLKKSAIIMLETLYGIKYDDIKPDDPVPEQESESQFEPVQEWKPDIDYDKLGEVIRTAVKDGMLDLITHKAEHDLILIMLKNAVKQGMRENIIDMREAHK